MKIYDISQEVFTCRVFGNDRAPEKYIDAKMSEGSLYNLTSFSMCAHNGTHIDAPFHFINDGETVDMISLEKLVGACYVSEQNCEIGAREAEEILSCAGKESRKRILIKGRGVVSEEAASVFASSGVYLVGVEGQTVGPEDGPMQVHKILLGSNAVLLEGIRLGAVKSGEYFLNAAPINLGRSDGAPCRAILIEQ